MEEFVSQTEGHTFFRICFFVGFFCRTFFPVFFHICFFAGFFAVPFFGLERFFYGVFFCRGWGKTDDDISYFLCGNRLVNRSVKRCLQTRLY